MSFYTSLNGLKNSQTNLDVIAHNIANVETTGFKKSKVAFADIVAGSAALALWKEQYHLSDSLVGTIGAFGPNAIGAGIGALVGGRLCDRIGRKKIYQWDMLVYAVGILVTVFLSNDATAIVLTPAVYAATHTGLNIWLIVVAASVGAIIGDNLGYWLGSRFGYPLLLRFGRVGSRDARRHWPHFGTEAAAPCHRLRCRP